MCHVLTTWIKNNLIYTSDSKTEADHEFDQTRKGYNNKFIISEKLIAPEESFITMDVEIAGQHVKTVETTLGKNKTEKLNLPNEIGDVWTKVSGDEGKKNVSAYDSKTKSKTELTYKEFISQECTKRQAEKFEEIKREQGQNDANAEILGIPLPFRSIGERSSLTNLHNLYEQCPPPQPPLVNKQLKSLQLNADQAIIMAEQVNKMKTGMERLQEIIKKYNCTDKFKQDIDFIIANIGPAIAKAEQMRRSDQTVCKTPDKNKLVKK